MESLVILAWTGGIGNPGRGGIGGSSGKGGSPGNPGRGGRIGRTHHQVCLDLEVEVEMMDLNF